MENNMKKDSAVSKETLSAETAANEQKVKTFSKAIAKIKSEISKDVVGQEEIVNNVITAIIAG